MPDSASFADFYTSAIPKTISLLLRVYEIARLRSMTAIADGAREISEGLLRDVNHTAVELAGTADGLIIRKMFDTQSRNRPMTGNMESHVLSLPGALGLVQVAMIGELDKIVNPTGYGPFWRAQEYGTGGSEVVSQVGRTFLGTFEPGGGAPDAAQRGLGAGHDAAFVSSTEDDAGRGTISVELPGRHFLRDGTAEAGKRYLAAMAAVQLRWVDRIEALTAQAKAEFSGTKYVRIIRA